MPSKPSLRTNTVWLVASNIGQRISEFLIGIILARLLAPSDFGLLVTIQVFTGAAGFVAGGGMGQALIQSKNITPLYFNVVFTIQLLICCFIYSIFFISAPWFAEWYSTPLYEDLVRVSALSFIIRPFSGCSRAKLHREMRFKSIALINLLSLLITGGTTITFALYGFGVWSLVLGGLVGAVFMACGFMASGKILFKLVFDRSIAKKMWSYGTKTSVNDIISYVNSQAPNLIIGKFLGPNWVGLYNKGDSLSQLPSSIITSSTYQTIFRELSSSQDDISKSQYIYLKAITLVTVYTYPFYIGLFCLSEPFIKFIYGDKWLLASIPLQIFSISGLFRCITSLSGAVMAAQNLLGTEIKIQLLCLLLTVIGSLYGAINNSLTIICFAIFPSYLVMLILHTYYSLKTLKIKLSTFICALKPAILMNASLVAVLIFNYYLLAFLQNVNFFVEITLFDYELAFKPPTISPEMYFIIMSFIGGLFYALLFLYWPIQSLKTEAMRWKKILKLARME